MKHFFPDRPLTVKDMVQTLGRNRDYYYSEIKSKRLKASNLGSGICRPTWRILPSDAMAWFEAKSNQLPRTSCETGSWEGEAGEAPVEPSHMLCSRQKQELRPHAPSAP